MAVTRQRAVVLSRLLSKFLDELGYSKEAVERRVLTQNKHSEALRFASKAFDSSKYILRQISGSRREGVALQGERDEDVIHENYRLAAICDNFKGDFDERTKHRFQLDKRCVPAGYTRLRLISPEQGLNGIEDKLVRFGKNLYFSSGKCMEQFMNDMNFKSLPILGKSVHYEKMTGPSLPKTIQFPCHEKMPEFFPSLSTFLMLWNDKKDAVRAIPCYCPDILRSWKYRQRLFEWPNHQTIEEACKKRSHVVPVGMKNCEGSDFQWRLSFSFAEKHLVRSFNDTQTKLFIILRHIARHFLDDMLTSYIVKNVVFWECENTPMDLFVEDELLNRVEDSLISLRGYVEKGVLDNYMIPERNLLHGKFCEVKRELLLMKIDHLINNGIDLLDKYFACKQREKEYPVVDKLLKEKKHLKYRDEVFHNLLCLFSSEEFGDILYKHYQCTTVEMFYTLNISLFILPYLEKYGTESLTGS